jgi:hypothetical protein
MHTLQVPIAADGALVDVRIGLSAADVQALRQAGRPVPAPVPGRALIDPGAEVSCVETRTLGPLAAAGLVAGRFVFGNLPAVSGVTLAPEYTVHLTIVHPSGQQRANLELRSQPLLELPLGVLGYQLLIGRDVLRRCLLVYDGPAERVTLGY